MSGAPVLRSYQVEDLHRVEAEIAAGRRRVLLTEVCGGGKTVTAVSNAMVLTEGFDLPELGCIVLSRPTRHVGLFRQMLGRGLQPAPGKTDCLVLDHSGAVFTHGFIEDAVNWTLDVDGRAENRAHKARAEHRAPALSVCPQCSAVRVGGGPCQACGWRPEPKPVAVEVADGELGRVDQARRIAEAFSYRSAEKHQFHAMLTAIARERGYARGWIAHKYREKFGDWPPLRHVEPLEPDAATRALVRSRVIAYAKVMERQRQAAS